MKKPRSDAVNTRLSLLEAAAEVFGNKGFWSATHEEICSKAKANTAAVNYHFGSKENLYIEAWKHSFKKSLEKYPLEGEASSSDPAEKRLRGWVLSFLQRVSDPETHAANIMFKEMANPTGLLKEVIAPTIEPSERTIKLILKELIGAGADEDLIGFCHMSLLSLCFGPMLHLRSGKESTPVPGPDYPVDLGVEELADFIIRFSLSGIRSFNKSAKSVKSNQKANKPITKTK